MTTHKELLTMSYKLPPELKAEWLEALKSGEYPHGTDYLISYVNGREAPPTGFCCLGVLRQLKGYSAAYNTELLADPNSGIDNPSPLPRTVQLNLAGINDSDGESVYLGDTYFPTPGCSVADHNLGFTHVIRYIEENL